MLYLLIPPKRIKDLFNRFVVNIGSALRLRGRVACILERYVLICITPSGRAKDTTRTVLAGS
ncbi:hypothetical protein M404DRAFT_1006893 [Pisolithus tinctorius Marx 270]|uniref:Uncharacterized protein n=1 Tax=Pisolithus tinctorius Marx 270 TaxID=870435 RepID=A0A0C3JF97_PISTI|nr:hypothetical protein M404DRAFT_1006893 [Pisolithus tinctorius Marx 270]